MPAYYQYNCDSCDYGARRYRNVRRCKCGGNLIRSKPQLTKQVTILIVLLAVMLLACGGEPAITGARSAAKTCAISLVATDADVESLDFVVEGLSGHWTATGKYNDGLNAFSVNFTLEPCAETE